ncbi:MAG TPA: hypothetical protein VMW72_26220 [Sedimentisphaerales bacterium]|nr:hypothetical protein [Sedimentisphaerales bacterium]
MNVNIYYSKAYNNETAFRRGKNKPNSNPNKPNLRKAKMIVSLTLTKDYRKNDDFIVRINKPNLVRRRRIANERKLTYNKGLQKKRLFSTLKNKPNSNPIKPNFLLDPNIKELIFIFYPGTVSKDYHTERILR